jgi:hypothetical protein
MFLLMFFVSSDLLFCVALMLGNKKKVGGNKLVNMEVIYIWNLVLPKTVLSVLQCEVLSSHARGSSFLKLNKTILPHNIPY